MIYQERVFDACFCSLLHYFPRIHRPDEKRKKKHARRCQLSHLFSGEQHMVNVSISSA